MGGMSIPITGKMDHWGEINRFSFLFRCDFSKSESVFLSLVDFDFEGLEKKN